MKLRNLYQSLVPLKYRHEIYKIRVAIAPNLVPPPSRRPLTPIPTDQPDTKTSNVSPPEIPALRRNIPERLQPILDALRPLPGQWHEGGTLSIEVLEAIAHHLYAVEMPLVHTLETGCGKSTILLSNVSAHHQVFAFSGVDNSWKTVSEFPFMKKERVELINGPTQRTMPVHQFEHKLQFALIDGPHGYPFPDLEYYYIYPHLAEGALLVIDDIHIPNIRNMFEFLCAEDMFRLEEVVSTTAFFRRTAAPTFAPLGDGWWLQRYNRDVAAAYVDVDRHQEHLQRQALESPSNEKSMSATIKAYEQLRVPKVLTTRHSVAGFQPTLLRKDLGDYVLRAHQGKADLVSRLGALDIQVETYHIDSQAFRNYWRDARYDEDFPDYYSGEYAIYRPEKALEHFISVDLMKLQPGQVYMDVASSISVVPTIFRRLYGVTVYRQDLIFPEGVHGDTIGGDAAAMPISDGFADAMALHCSFEQFEGDLDMAFIREAGRVLKPGGILCILPLYLASDYYISVDPVIAVDDNVDVGTDGVVYAIPDYQVRYARYYSPEIFVERITPNLGDMQLTVYDIVNHKEIDPNTYVEFAAVLRKPL